MSLISGTLNFPFPNPDKPEQKSYAELFQVKQSQCKEFRTCEAGWWKTDVKKIREMGINVTDLCERYCRVTHIKVPFPLLVDYDLLCRSG